MCKKDTTIVICCAGMGKRLGIGTSKALLDINGKPLILRQLELLDDYDDIRIVVGYQAEDVIRTVLSYRKDIMFVFNYKYESTSVVTSMNKAIIKPRKYVVEMDGDILINPDDLDLILKYPGECIGGNDIHSDKPIGLKVRDEKVLSFENGMADYEWSGLAKIKSDRLIQENKYLYLSLERFLPLAHVYIRSRDIDTPDDYMEALDWYNNDFKQKREE